MDAGSALWLGQRGSPGRLPSRSGARVTGGARRRPAAVGESTAAAVPLGAAVLSVLGPDRPRHRQRPAPPRRRPGQRLAVVGPDRAGARGVRLPSGGPGPARLRVLARGPLDLHPPAARRAGRRDHRRPVLGGPHPRGALDGRRPGPGVRARPRLGAGRDAARLLRADGPAGRGPAVSGCAPADLGTAADRGARRADPPLPEQPAPDGVQPERANPQPRTPAPTSPPSGSGNATSSAPRKPARTTPPRCRACTSPR